MVFDDTIVVVVVVVVVVVAGVVVEILVAVMFFSLSTPFGATPPGPCPCPCPSPGLSSATGDTVPTPTEDNAVMVYDVVVMVAAAVGCLKTGRGLRLNAFACSFNVGT